MVIFYSALTAGEWAILDLQTERLKMMKTLPIIIEIFHLSFQLDQVYKTNASALQTHQFAKEWFELEEIRV